MIVLKGKGYGLTSCMMSESIDEMEFRGVYNMRDDGEIGLLGVVCFGSCVVVFEHCGDCKSGSELRIGSSN